MLEVILTSGSVRDVELEGKTILQIDAKTSAIEMSVTSNIAAFRVGDREFEEWKDLKEYLRDVLKMPES